MVAAIDHTMAASAIYLAVAAAQVVTRVGFDLICPGSAC